MTINRISNTPIKPSIFHQYGFNDRRKQNKNCVVTPNGDLYVAISLGGSYSTLYGSTDGGFSWSAIATGSNDDPTAAGNAVNVVGSMLNLAVNETWSSGRLWGRKYWAANDHDINQYDFPWPDCNDNDNTEVVETIYQGVFNMTYNVDQNFLAYVNQGANKISLVRQSPRSYLVVSAAAELSTDPVFNVFDITCNKDNKVYFLYMHQTGAKNYVKFVTWTPEGGYTTAVTVENLGDTDHEMGDPSIVLDGYGNIGVFYSKNNYTTDTCVMRYAVSTDSGATFSVQTITDTAGNTPYLDKTDGGAYAWMSAMGGSKGGFIFTYVRSRNALATTFVRLLTTTDGATYTLGDEKRIATADRYVGKDIVGAHFFLPAPHSKLLDISDPGLVRVAFRVGDTNDDDLTTDTPIGIYQELLYESAYPSALDSDATEYTQDVAGASSILVSFEVLPGPEENVDYYSLGLTGLYTDRYEEAFQKVGTTAHLLRYEPDAENYMNDRSAYGSPTEYAERVIFAPQTYVQPTPDLASTNVTAWVEQDVRKLYLPPDFHLGRTFLVNEGGYLKRTVWTLSFAGNEYEISQVVPYFLDNQICYYGANCYVIGPSRNPFSRAVLPSET